MTLFLFIPFSIPQQSRNQASPRPRCRILCPARSSIPLGDNGDRPVTHSAC